VRAINGGSISGSGAYILFYKRKDWNNEKFEIYWWDDLFN
jgi:hypothetical protein